jgi:hypothetical protein
MQNRALGPYFVAVHQAPQFSCLVCGWCHPGVVTLSPTELLLEGSHKATREPFRLALRPTQLKEVHHGFDSVFNVCLDRSNGLLTFQPLRLTYTGVRTWKRLSWACVTETNGACLVLFRIGLGFLT